MDSLRQRLDELKIRPRAAPPIAAAPPSDAPPATLSEILGGRETATGGRRCWMVETPLDDGASPRAPITAIKWGEPTAAQDARLPAELPLDRIAVIDLETGGFSGAPVFLIGVLLPGGPTPRITQFLARDYPEEEGILRAIAVIVAERDAWVTFNGKSFDEPFLRDRALVHRVPLRPPSVHVDVLHVARRRWRATLPDCRLATLEREVLGRTRVGDIPGSDVPDLFHHFIRTGNARPLRGVLEHNRLDLAASFELLLKLVPP